MKKKNRNANLGPSVSWSLNFAISVNGLIKGEHAVRIKGNIAGSGIMKAISHSVVCAKPLSCHHHIYVSAGFV